MPTNRRPPIDKVAATRQAIMNARAVVQLGAGTPQDALETFIRFIENTWIEEPAKQFRPDQN